MSDGKKDVLDKPEASTAPLTEDETQNVSSSDNQSVPPQEGGNTNEEADKSKNELDDAKKLKEKFGKNQGGNKFAGNRGANAGNNAARQTAQKAGNKAFKEAGKKAAQEVGKKAAEEAGKQAGRAAAQAGAEVGAEAAAAGAAPETLGASLIAEKLTEEALKYANALRKDLTNFNFQETSKLLRKRAKTQLKIIVLPVLAGILFWLMFFLIIVWVFLLVLKHKQDEATKAAGGLTLTKNGPTFANKGDLLTYGINVSYNQAADDITVTDQIPAGTDYVTAGQIAHYDPTTKTVTWSTKENNPSSPSTGIFTLILKATVANLYLANIANATVKPAVSNIPVQGYVPPAAADSCGGKYANLIKKNNLLPKNYGDPVCSYTKDKQYTLLKQQAKIDACGAWGLYQMGSSGERVAGQYICAPGQPPPSPGKNGPLDRGDVNWEVQTLNAIQYNKNQHCSFRYWATARSVWGKYSC